MQPDVALVWFNEPDTSFHYRFLGSPETLSVLRHVDAAFGRILAWIETQPDADRYAVIAASDHGQISTSGALSLVDLLGEQGHAGRRAAERSSGARKPQVGKGDRDDLEIDDDDLDIPAFLK